MIGNEWLVSKILHRILRAVAWVDIIIINDPNINHKIYPYVEKL